jgi:hypothetical protein
MRKSEEMRAIADTLRLRSRQRSWRTVETAGRDADSLGIGGHKKEPADKIPARNLDDWGENAGKVGMQSAAAIGRVPVMMMRMGLCTVGVIVCVLVMAIGMDCIRNWLLVCERGRYHARELGDQEQGDQHTDKATYRSQPFHLRFDRNLERGLTFWTNRGICQSIGSAVQRGYICARHLFDLRRVLLSEFRACGSTGLNRCRRRSAFENGTAVVRVPRA